MINPLTIDTNKGQNRNDKTINDKQICNIRKFACDGNIMTKQSKRTLINKYATFAMNNHQICKKNKTEMTSGH